MKRSKEEDEKKSKQEKMEKRREGFLHSWFMYSRLCLGMRIYRLIQADMTNFKMGFVRLSRSSDTA